MKDTFVKVLLRVIALISTFDSHLSWRVKMVSLSHQFLSTHRHLNVFALAIPKKKNLMQMDNAML